MDVTNLPLSLQQLMQELETERERRWKAEQATHKLADHIRELQDRGGLQSLSSYVRHLKKFPVSHQPKLLFVHFCGVSVRNTPGTLQKLMIVTNTSVNIQ